MSNQTKKTKQGVRDLNSLPGKSVGKKYVPPPVMAMDCSHKGSVRATETGESICLDCGQLWDWNGKPINY